MRNLTYWISQLAVWYAYYWVQYSGEAIFASVPWEKARLMWGTVAAANLLLTHGTRTVSKHFQWTTLPPYALLARVLIAVAIVSVLIFEVHVMTARWVYGTPVAPIYGSFYAKLPESDQLFNVFVICVGLNVAWASSYFAFAIQRQRWRAEVMQMQLSEALQAAELRLLKSQLNPHFLFNALNGVRALIADEPTRAQDAVTQLARALRYTLASGDTDFVTLAREMEMVDDYLALESLRLAERLQIVREIEPAATHARIPVMLLQTLVENAIKHGIAPLRQGGTLHIAARIDGKALVIEVSNPRPPGPTALSTVAGVGLKNSSERLRLLFGPSASLELDLSDPQRAVATVRVPT